MSNGAFIAIFTSFMTAIITIAIKQRKDKKISLNKTQSTRFIFMPLVY